MPLIPLGHGLMNVGQRLVIFGQRILYFGKYNRIDFSSVDSDLLQVAELLSQHLQGDGRDELFYSTKSLLLFSDDVKDNWFSFCTDYQSVRVTEYEFLTEIKAPYSFLLIL